MINKEEKKKTECKSVKHVPSSIYVDIKYYDLSAIMHPEYTQISKKAIKNFKKDEVKEDD